MENGFSCFSDDDVLTEYVKNVKPLKTYFDVALHGAPNAVGFGSTEMNMSARMLASVIRHSIGWNGQKNQTVILQHRQADRRQLLFC